MKLTLEAPKRLKSKSVLTLRKIKKYMKVVEVNNKIMLNKKTIRVAPEATQTIAIREATLNHIILTKQIKSLREM